ncbi:MAG TPA: RNA pseudouridine synthase [Candidatus Sulfotelmatobacter sp.]|jgi:tRNA pseudouridine32 synthase/23S rRNA pseudouridine746 synthase|nr:RNA pseudouridine synthase [Candidatus Sulfotelmatobacter sp.]
MSPEDLIARILYRDALMLVVDKPSGLAVHAAGKGDEHLGLYLDALRFGLPRPPELAHRLDRDTSGCLALGRNRHGLKRLGELFAGREARKVYWAVVVGAPPTETGLIDKPLTKVDAKHGWRMKIDPKGQPSQTEWRLLGRTERLSWLECRPLTGRTHQIRVHLASMGLPIVGDAIYGKGTATLVSDRLHLHARQLTLPLYPKKSPITVTAPAPQHMADALAACGWDGV